MPTGGRKRTRQDPSEDDEADDQDSVEEAPKARAKRPNTQILTPESVRAAKAKSLQEQKRDRHTGARNRNQPGATKVAKGLIQIQPDSTVHLPSVPVNDDKGMKSDGPTTRDDPIPPPPRQASTRMGKPKPPPKDDDNEDEEDPVTLDAFVAQGQEKVVDDHDDDDGNERSVGLVMFFKQQRTRRWLSISFVLLVAVAVAAAVAWTALLLRDYTNCQLQSKTCKDQVAEWQMLLGRQSSDDLYLTELEHQILYWKKEAKKHQSFAEGYHQHCQEQVALWMETILE